MTTNQRKLIGDLVRAICAAWPANSSSRLMREIGAGGPFLDWCRRSPQPKAFLGFVSEWLSRTRAARVSGKRWAREKGRFGKLLWIRDIGFAIFKRHPTFFGTRSRERKWRVEGAAFAEVPMTKFQFPKKFQAANLKFRMQKCRTHNVSVPKAENETVAAVA